VRTYAAICEADGRRIASYAIVAVTAEAALAMLDGWPSPDGADRHRILGHEGRETPIVQWPKNRLTITEDRVNLRNLSLKP